MSLEMKAKLLLILLGMIFGMVPMVYGILKKQVLLGVVSLVICTVLSVAGFPYFSIPAALLAFYAIYALCGKLEEKQQKENRSAYKKNLKAQLETQEGRLSGYIENRRAANAAWPPVTSCMDEDAAAEYQQLAEEEHAASQK